MNRCDISEEETTSALHALYQIPPPENQNGVQYQPGINSVDQVNFNYQNVVSDYMTDGRKKVHKLNKTSKKGSKAVLSSAAKKFQMDSVKKEDLNDMKQLTNGVNSVKESDNSKNSNRQRQKHVPGGLSFIFALLIPRSMLMLDSLILYILSITNSLQAMLI